MATAFTCCATSPVPILNITGNKVTGTILGTHPSYKVNIMSQTRILGKLLCVILLDGLNNNPNRIAYGFRIVDTEGHRRKRIRPGHSTANEEP